MKRHFQRQPRLASACMRSPVWLDLLGYPGAISCPSSSCAHRRAQPGSAHDSQAACRRSGSSCPRSFRRRLAAVGLKVFSIRSNRNGARLDLGVLRPNDGVPASSLRPTAQSLRRLLSDQAKVALAPQNTARSDSRPCPRRRPRNMLADNALRRKPRKLPETRASRRVRVNSGRALRSSTVRFRQCLRLPCRSGPLETWPGSDYGIAAWRTLFSVSVDVCGVVAGVASRAGDERNPSRRPASRALLEIRPPRLERIALA